MGLRPDGTPGRVAMLSVHTSPLEQPGTGDAGGLNVYVVETAKRLARRGTEVEIFTRATAGHLPSVTEMLPGVLVRNIVAGPYEGLAKDDLPGQLCAFAAGVLRTEARLAAGWYDLIHSHYWLSGQVGWLAAERWNVPLLHTMHTMAKVKNLSLAADDRPEPAGRVIGEEQVVAAADRLIANTDLEARDLIGLYDADPELVTVIPPGVDLDTFTPQADGRARARQRLGLPADAELVLFVGRIQPLKAPDVLLRAVAALVAADPQRREKLVVAVLGGPSGSGLERPEELQKLAVDLGIGDLVRFHPPVGRPVLAEWYRAADLVAVPSYSESFGLVAVEAQACGTPVVAARVGGLATAVRDGRTGLLVTGHEPATWARALEELLRAPLVRERMSRAAVRHANLFSWDHTVDATLETYAAACAAHELGAPPGRLAAGGPQLVVAAG
ncbi:D-inositol-3-phosphate glycosyltransferase [Kineosporia rhizophila]|uniref:D-inositol-3-phosphate glycosyltransferase n=1 Tax=Kineosporia TaxID=49184 RepID=UPI001E33F70C|nr:MULTISPECIES: D-inositol-3-phosphate glycosyltransferase [Kineosporia]MCE0539805.1 D-inositol-3-phosphate glycosyltransferase [Kineosporia rhizophila]GLY13394.1 D-inositol 3-phosphate glycosyltransferase [Kineosporia sp. NBRC 101677]